MGGLKHGLAYIVLPAVIQDKINIVQRVHFSACHSVSLYKMSCPSKNNELIKLPSMVRIHFGLLHSFISDHFEFLFVALLSSFCLSWLLINDHFKFSQSSF